MVMKTAIIGTKGFLGKHFHAHYGNVFTTAHNSEESDYSLNFIAPNLKGLLLPEDYRYALICGAITNVVACEQNPVLSYAVNVTGPLAVARHLYAQQIIPIFFSSDYVFDGEQGCYTENSLVNPLNVYGQHKAELEQRALDLFQGDCLVLRMSKIYGADKGDGTLIDELCHRLFLNIPILAAENQRFCPLAVKDVISIVTQLQKENRRGLYHIAGAEPLSRYELAIHTAHAMKKNAALITKINLQDLQEVCQRPTDTTLITRKIEQEIFVNRTSVYTSIAKHAAHYCI